MDGGEPHSPRQEPPRRRHGGPVPPSPSKQGGKAPPAALTGPKGQGKGKAAAQPVDDTAVVREHMSFGQMKVNARDISMISVAVEPMGLRVTEVFGNMDAPILLGGARDAPPQPDVNVGDLIVAINGFKLDGQHGVPKDLFRNNTHQDVPILTVPHAYFREIPLGLAKRAVTGALRQAPEWALQHAGQKGVPRPGLVIEKAAGGPRAPSVPTAWIECRTS